jgi:hypothetical protein
MLVIWKKGHLKKYKEECWYCGKKDISRNIKKNVGTVEKRTSQEILVEDKGI